MPLSRAYALVSVKDFDPDRRTFSGLATSPQPDRLGDTIASSGVTYKNPLPLLLYHDSTKPVGEVSFSRPTSDGTPFKALISQLDRDSGVVKERLDEAVDSLAAKPPLIRGVSIGFRPLADPTFNKETGGLHFSKIEVLELSMVVIPAHQDATIAVVKSLDQPHLAALGTDAAAVHPAGVTAPRAATPARKDSRSKVKTYSEQITDWTNRRAETEARLETLQQKATGEGRAKDETEREQFAELKAELKSIDDELTDARDMEALMAKKAVPVSGKSTEDAGKSREGVPVIRVSDQKLPPGIGFARSIMCQVEARLDQRNILEVAKARYPSDTRLHQYLQYKAAVPAGTTTNDPWASPLVDPANLAGEFIEFLRPKTIVDRFGTNGIPSLQRVPFNVRIVGQSTGGVAGWTGQGKAKPVTSFGYNAVTLLYTKIAAIAVITEELARFSTPSAEARVRDSLAKCVVERLDIDFVDPAQAAVSGVNPASITNGLTALSSAGTSADNVRTDLVNLLSSFVENNQDPSGLVLIMPTSLALGLSIMTNTLGQSEFPDVGMSGGKIKGIPVLTSQYAANQSGAGNLVIAVNTNEVFLADDGQVKVDASREASIEMSDAPLGNSGVPTASSVSVVSMYQTNSIALRAERFVNWAKARAEAVVYMDDVNWGSVGSP